MFMFENQTFVKSVFDLKEIPSDIYPEVIICGRSNVGKSSFINSLFNRKDLARTSATPGKTRSLNYYLIDKNFYIVDLPGFGYAKISKNCLLYTSPSPRDRTRSRMPSSA